jgi:SAM-dependent methyltransferase
MVTTGPNTGQRGTIPMGAFLQTYPAHIARLRSMLDQDTAMRMAVGGSFYASGRLQYLLMRQLGVTPTSNVVDVGCGSGRLAVHLAAHPELQYLGTDIVPDLLEHARKLTQRPDWQFVLTNGTLIPAGDATADYVCFFSVLTHVKHEESFRYLAEAKRVLCPDGRIVFSFLEFGRPFHWAQFESTLLHGCLTDPLTQFMDRDAIRAWTDHLGLRIETIYDGGVPHIPIDEEIAWDDGRKQTGLGDIGHSVAVLSKIG